MTFKNILLGVATAAGVGAAAIAFGKTKGLPRYILGVAGIEGVRRLGRRLEQIAAERRRDVVEFNSEQSFPASDPPGWSVG